MTRLTRLIGVSNITLLPWSLGPGGPRRAVRIAKQSGFGWLQVLPLQGWGKFPTEAYKMSLYYEEEWNAGNPLQALLRFFGILGDNHPTFRDLVVFGDKEAVARRTREFERLGLTLVTHNPTKPGILEIQAGSSLSTLGLAERPGGVCFDTYHVFEAGLDWKATLDVIGDNIKLIHAQERPGAPLNPEMLRALAEATSCPVIYEGWRGSLKQFLMTEPEMISWLRGRREYLGQFFD